MNRRVIVAALIAMLTFGSMLGAPSPAFAVTPGSVKAHINNTPGNPSFSVSATASGWARGDIDVSVKLFVGPTKTGPWEKISELNNTCQDSTSCSTASGFYGLLLGTCYDPGAWYKAVGRASGRGGSAENNPDIVIKHIYGQLQAREQDLNAAAASAVPARCKVIYVQI